MKKLLSVILALAMLLSFGAVVAFAGVDCDCDDCEVVDCACIGEDCDDADCECDCHAVDVVVPPPAPLSGYELWKAKLEESGLLKKLASWGDGILKFLYYVCFGWLYNIAIDITITPK